MFGEGAGLQETDEISGDRAGELDLPTSGKEMALMYNEN
jgi:hypothetical protein